eukprot:351185-Chlamydomonas_euryale.AAC.3
MVIPPCRRWKHGRDRMKDAAYTGSDNGWPCPVRPGLPMKEAFCLALAVGGPHSHGDCGRATLGQVSI